MLKRAARLLILSILILTTALSAAPLAHATPTDHPNTYKNTGDMRADLIGVALTQVGYLEGSGNDTKYGVWYGLNYRGWCGMFVAWCAEQAGIPKSVIPKTGVSSPSAFKVTARSGKDYRPQPGDLFFTPNGNTYSHVGIVDYLDGDYFYTLEGNTYKSGQPEGVYIHRRKIVDFVFGTPNYPSTGNEHAYYVGYESAHPHKEYKKCDHCGDKYYTGKTQTSSDCKQCTVASCKHSYGKWTSSGSSKHARTCTKCGNKETASHTWDKGKTTTKATCAQKGQTTYTCTGCSATRTESIAKLTTHTYGAWEYISEKQHARVCQVCSKKETAKHAVADTMTWDSNTHWYACADCSGHIQEQTHVFGLECDSPCQLCGLTREGGHGFGETWETDSDGHWRICGVCGVLSEKTAHTFDDACDSLCDICGYERQVAHTFSTHLFSDETGHWRECGQCGLTTDAQPHQPGEEATEEHAQLCALCGWELAPKLEHVHNYAPTVKDALSHSRLCVCGAQLEDEGHAWDMAAFGCSACGYSLKDSWPTLALLCAVPATALLFGLLLLIHRLRRRFW